MKKDDVIPLRFGTGNVDWQQRINWEELRKKRMERSTGTAEKEENGTGAEIHGQVENWISHCLQP